MTAVKRKDEGSEERNGWLDSPIGGGEEGSADPPAGAVLAVAEPASRAVGNEGSDEGVVGAALGRAGLEEAEELFVRENCVCVV